MDDKEKNSGLEKDLQEIYSDKEDMDLRAKWASSLKDDYQILRKVKNDRRRLWYSLAAVFIVGIATFTISFFFADNQSVSSDSYIAEFEVISNATYGQRGTSLAEGHSLLISAYQKMLKEDFQEAIQIYEKAQEMGELGDYEKFHLALGYLKTNQAKKSILILNKLIEGKSKYQEEANWLLSLGYLSNNQNKKAKEILNNIIKLKSYKFQKAEQLLNSLN